MDSELFLYDVFLSWLGMVSGGCEFWNMNDVCCDVR